MVAHSGYLAEGRLKMHAGDKTKPHQMDGTYPDMNYIFFKGIPKMIQVADDMHRMTDYIMDLRNMTIGFVCFLFMGALIFLFLRHIQKQSGADMRERKIIADHPEDLGKSARPYSGTCKSYSEPWHGPAVKTSAVILEEELSGKTKSTLPTVKVNGCVANARFGNDRNHSNNSLLKVYSSNK
ncbi:hypothetical protein LOAG_07301 [Loa loa]|uniref:Transmembrane protein n=1 Tax=Loa loa TaxID=7209 RepID=A0A1I7V9P1_LOALO|nr:hypothetical protein LOAG_07301 [Loa loa]EFO21192.1 hypothetical protein LOAG_07301 [Loa loa]